MIVGPPIPLPRERDRRGSGTLIRVIRRLLIALELVVALNAAGGAAYALGGAPNVPERWLEGTPFADYTVPGLMLALGAVLMLAAAAGLLTRRPNAPQASIAAGVLLVSWIAVQVALIGYVSWMQPVSAGAGVAIALLAELLRRRQPSAQSPRDACAET